MFSNSLTATTLFCYVPGHFFFFQLLTHTHTRSKANKKRGCTALKFISKGNWSKHNLFNVTAIKRLTRITHTTSSHKYMYCTPAAQICERAAIAKTMIRRRRRRNDNCRAKRSKIKWAPAQRTHDAEASGREGESAKLNPHVEKF